MQIFNGRLLLLSVALSILSACSDIPGGAPSARQILDGAEEEDAAFAVIPINKDTLPKVRSWPSKEKSEVQGWLSRKKGPSSQVVEPGDLMDLAIWDSGDTSLLSQPGQKVVSISAIRVTPEGNIFLPYVDEVSVAKKTPDEARDTIQEQFSKIIPSAQVQLTHTPGRESSVDLISGVTKPGNYPLPDRDFTVLSLLAAGGGISDKLVNPQVRLMRGGNLYGISASRLTANPSLDTTLRGGDKVFVAEDKRYFLSLGAAGTEAQIPFPSDRISALDAASLIGGVQESRGNPKGVLVLRNYAPTDLRSDGSGPNKQRMIFAVDLTTADGLFSAGEFDIADRDLVLVTESSITQTDAVLSVVYNMLGIPIRTQNALNN